LGQSPLSVWLSFFRGDRQAGQLPVVVQFVVCPQTGRFRSGNDFVCGERVELLVRHVEKFESAWAGRDDFCDSHFFPAWGGGYICITNESRKN